MVKPCGVLAKYRVSNYHGAKGKNMRKSRLLAGFLLGLVATASAAVAPRRRPPSWS